jgi:hypothetical protein
MRVGKERAVFLYRKILGFFFQPERRQRSEVISELQFLSCRNCQESCLKQRWGSIRLLEKSINSGSKLSSLNLKGMK